LKELIVSYTNVANLNPLKDLNKLQILDISFTQVYDLDALEECVNLRKLSLSGTAVNDLMPLKNLTKLHTLYADGTAIDDLGSLRELKCLRELFINETKIDDLSPLNDLRQLQVLDLQYTAVVDMNPLKELENLQTLNLYGTQVGDISALKRHIKNNMPVKWESFGNGISIKDCPLLNPPRHIVRKGNKAILRYWQELEYKETSTNNQTKLIFVGNSRAGKTSLWQFLKDKIYNEQADSTHGIKTEIWDTETLGTADKQNLAAHIWDFGGQEYYHATHRLFLADNAVYVLVWEHDSNKQGTRLEKFKLDDDPKAEIEEVELEHFPASYWLENIQYFAGKHCPVLIVQNKVDEEAQKANYTEGGKNLPDCFHLSVQNAFGFQQGNPALEESNMDFQKFKLRLLKELRKNATAFKLVKYYAQVREALETKAKDTEYIPVSELKDIALQFDETPDLENLLAYLKSFTNTVLYFPKNAVLKDRLYLNPTHISRDIYKILNKQVREKNGKFDVAHIKTRLNLTDDQEAERFVALMREFDLIFEKQDEASHREFVTPQYLPEKDKLSKDIQFFVKRTAFENALSIRFKSFVPRSLMLRFIANNGVLSDGETYWRNGIIYESPLTNAMIKVEYDHEALTFTICVQDKNKQTIDMQNIVEQFVSLENNSDEHIKISNDGKAYFDLRKIRILQSQNRKEIDNDEGQYAPLSIFDWLTQKIEIKDIMDLTKLKETVLNFIGKAKTKEAMEAVATYAHANNQAQLNSDISLLKGDLAALSRQQTLGMMDFKDHAIETAKLNNRLMNMLNGIEEANTKVETSPNEGIPKAPVAEKAAKQGPLSIFISYSKSDKDMMESFRKYLKPLERKGAIKTWADTNLKAGDDWHKAIEHQLNTADIIVFLVSSDLINTDYIWDVEMPIAFKRHDDGEAKIVPIILRDCGWHDTDFAKLNALPEKGRPVTTYRTQDDAWFYVYEKLKELLK
jgi:GTPase SAR1 family protein